MLSVQLATGDEIWNKMKTVRGDGCDDKNVEDSNAILVEKARALLSNAETKKDGKKGLLTMNFMQKSLEKRRERAKEEAR
mmetsp:Transcript_6911/g.7063  ORF Transcript_6911/g.7063 Transcript_6911/m.7063 type:complete len:80 (+) Transcript_6911:72-311(+)